jgi:hypothetical protein
VKHLSLPRDAGNRYGATKMSPYQVLVDDNYHYMDEDERWELGTFQNAEAAVGACRQMIDRWLLASYKEGVTAERLYEHYVAFGEDPFIVAVGDAPAVQFSAWHYASERAAQFTAPDPEGARQRQAVLDRKSG